MVFEKGNTEGSKSNGGGRKTFSKELLKRATELKKEEIAEDIMVQHLLSIKNSKIPAFKLAKELALPISLKGMTDKSQVDVKLVKPLLGGQSNVINDNGSDKQAPSTEEKD